MKCNAIFVERRTMRILLTVEGESVNEKRERESERKFINSTEKVRDEKIGNKK